MHVTVRFQVPPPLWTGLYVKQKLNRNLETEAHGAETPTAAGGTGIAVEADFPLALPRAGLPLSQGFHVGTGDWLETRPFGLSLLPLTWGGGPPSPNSQQGNEREPLCILHAPALLPGCHPTAPARHLSPRTADGVASVSGVWGWNPGRVPRLLVLPFFPSWIYWSRAFGQEPS